MRWCAVLVRALLLAALPGPVGCSGHRESEEETPSKRRLDERGNVVLTAAERDAIDLSIAEVQDGTLVTETLRFGTVVARPQEDALVVAPVTGRLRAPEAQLGASVEQGAALVQVEPLVDTASRASLQAERRQLWGRIESAEAEVKAKQAELERVTTLVTAGLATEAERAQAEATLRSEQARAQSFRQANGELVRITGGALTLRAPTSGTVATLGTPAGSLVQQGAIVARIVRAGPRWIDVAVPPADPVGEDYRVRGTFGELPAQLLTRGSVVQPDGTRRDRLEAAPEAAPRLLPGATVAVAVLHHHRGILVPVAAIVRRHQDTLVFVELEEGRFAPRPLTVGAREGDRALVTSGLKAGDRIVTRGSVSLLGELGMGRTDEGRR